MFEIKNHRLWNKMTLFHFLLLEIEMTSEFSISFLNGVFRKLKQNFGTSFFMTIYFDCDLDNSVVNL